MLLLGTVIAASVGSALTAFVRTSKPVRRVLEAQLNAEELAWRISYQDEIWDGASVIGEDGENDCDIFRWAQPPEPNLLRGGKPPSLCLRSYKDYVSTAIKGKGRWPDCDDLARLWELPSRFNESVVFVEVGANIGACFLPMLARPDVHTALAFEPNPKNLFYLTHSLLANQETKAKASVYPFALGEKEIRAPIYMQDGNAGNSVVGKPVLSSHIPSSYVNIKTLDGVIEQMPIPPRIHLMKLDAQGYEVKIMKGASKLFASGAVEAVKFEIATEWLLKQGTSPVEYVNSFLQFGYHIHVDGGLSPMSQADLETTICGADNDRAYVHDFVALLALVDSIGSKLQQSISCSKGSISSFTVSD